MTPCKFHEYLNGALKCYFCGAAKPMLPGTWPTRTWFQLRRAYLRQQELKTTMAEVQEMKARGVLQ